jgi:anti-anti-sigma factor
VSPAPFETSATRLDDGVHVVAVRGELDLGTAADLEPSLEEIVSDGDANLLIDLTECEFIDSTGIALIVRSWQRLDRAGGGGGEGRVAVCTGNDQVRRVLEVTGLQASIPIHEGRDAALAALRSGPPANA